MHIIVFAFSEGIFSVSAVLLSFFLCLRVYVLPPPGGEGVLFGFLREGKEEGGRDDSNEQSTTLILMLMLMLVLILCHYTAFFSF